MTAKTPASPGLRLGLDYGPLLVFFAANFLVPERLALPLVSLFTGSLSAMNQLGALVIAKVIVASALFIIATAVAMLVSRARLGSISPMLWISGGLVFLFGGLTIWFHDPRFIQVKPTIVYATFALVLGFGLATGRPLLQQLLEATYPGLDAAGWRKLTINWTFFFAALAVANEVARALLSLDAWVVFKFPGCAILTFVFALANVPMLLRHGLILDDGAEERAAAGQLPPE